MNKNKIKKHTKCTKYPCSEAESEIKKQSKKTKLVMFVDVILTVLILCVFHHAWIFCWKKRKERQRSETGRKRKVFTEQNSNVPEAHVQQHLPSDTHGAC